MLTRSLWSWTLNFCALKALLSGCWPGRTGKLCTRKRSRQCCRSAVNSVCATSTSFTCAVSPGATAAAKDRTAVRLAVVHCLAGRTGDSRYQIVAQSIRQPAKEQPGTGSGPEIRGNFLGLGVHEASG